MQKMTTASPKRRYVPAKALNPAERRAAQDLGPLLANVDPDTLEAIVAEVAERFGMRESLVRSLVRISRESA